MDALGLLQLIFETTYKTVIDKPPVLNFFFVIGLIVIARVIICELISRTTKAGRYFVRKANGN